MTQAHDAATLLQQAAPNLKPRVGLVLGSGLTEVVDLIDNPVTVSYQTLPGFPPSTVSGQSGRVVMGSISGVDVVCLLGRAHAYEGGDPQIVATYIRTLKLLGCEYLVATNAAGSLRPEVGPGELMLITDHINLQPMNPLVGPNDEAFGERFYPLDDAYDPSMRNHLIRVASEKGIQLHQGVYLAVLGPHYETAAEIRAFRMLGADAVGMSTVPEVLVAKHCGLKVAVISVITNLATGLAATSHSHEAVVEMANSATSRLSQLLTGLLASLA